MRFIASSLLAMPITLLTAACSLRGPYVAPEPAPVVLTQNAAANVVEQQYDPRWWMLFQDPVLDRLEAAALRSNTDLRLAVTRVEQARAIFDDVRLDPYPTPGVGAAIDVREEAVPGFSNEPVRRTTYRAGFDMFWELDLFGGVRSAVSASEATAQAYEASLEDARVLVAAEVARNYFELRGVQQQLAVAERSLANRRETLRMTSVRRDAGVGEEQEVASAAASVAAVEARIPLLRAQAALLRHRLAVLSGVRPADLAEALEPRTYAPLATSLPLGETGALLRRRPDVRAAERRLASAAAREGVAAAD